MLGICDGSKTNQQGVLTELAFHITCQIMQFCMGVFFSITWRIFGKLRVSWTCPKSFNFFLTDWLALCLVAVYITSLVVDYKLLSFLFYLDIISLLVQASKVSWKFSDVLWSPHALTDLPCPVQLLILRFSFWSLHVLQTRQLIYRYMVSLPASSTWLNCFWVFIM